MLKYLILTLCFAWTVAEISAQSAVTLGEERMIWQMQEDTLKVMKLTEYAEKIQFSDPVKAIQIIEYAGALAVKLNYPLGQSVALGLRAKLFFYEMKLDSSKQLFNKAYALLNSRRDVASRKQMATIINGFAAIDYRQLNYVRAIERYLEAAGIFSETGDELKIINVYYNLSGIYKYVGDTAKTFFFARETNRLALHANDTVLLVRGLIALGEAYNFVKAYDSLLLVSEKGLQLAIKQNITFAVGIFNNLTGLYHANKTLQYDTAIAHYNRALESFKKINVQYDIALVLQNLGNVFLRKKDYANAIRFSRQAIELSKDFKFPLVLQAGLKDLVLAEEQLGNMAASYAYLKQYVQVNDSINSNNSQKKVYELEVRNQSQKKEVVLLAQQNELRRKNALNYMLLLGLLSLLIIIVLLYKNYRSKQKLHLQRIYELETQQKLTAAQAILKGEEMERTRLAKDLHDGLGGMLSGIKYSLKSVKDNLVTTADNALAFERSLDMLDSSIDEMRRLAHNMMPEALVKFGLDTALKDFCNQINQSGALAITYQSIGIENSAITQTTAIAVYRIVQELINNTMKHAAARAAVVQVSQIDKLLSVTVEDDGKGFDTATLQKQKGIGWDNIENRIEFLKGKIDIRSEAGKGTSIHIELSI